ncbi:phosphoadenylyl-sulfate reductase [Parvularcula lutaonensis]|uniref:Adenosine 5'-phosphosulfate reductase n=1 Tax=Parvularcula lutaonensis TaxID=491923 RepID=A0ABV7M8C5_9PROT|nr:phosphoadenylyl-sulfate reductase [Parvularcula lutaonensis]GGY56534.1 phosphoadenylyl-sulfate reductase (thioredoxin) [Parvularcula lutaonensis]
MPSDRTSDFAREIAAVRETALKIAALNERFEKLHPRDIIEEAVQDPFFGKMAVVSSFGAESAVLLHLVASVRPETPVLLIDTLKLFGETLQYQNRLQHSLGLEDVRICAPRKRDIEHHDPLGTLSASDPDKCCRIRKTDVLDRGLAPFDSWMNGRKRFQSSVRSVMSIVERDGTHIKLTPLANWSAEQIKAYHKEHELPPHPLLSRGYGSIGCYPCTSKVEEGEDDRSGRWRGLDKTECGIHR